MAKRPVAGRVKTRLARDIGVAAATTFARHAIAATLARVGSGRPWSTILALAPDYPVERGACPAGVPGIGQGRGDLGRRMQRLMDRMPPGPVVIVGTDIPEMRAAHIRDAFLLLGRHDAVFGPASDGGYWLVGLRRRPSILRTFQHVRWSGPYALADTLANLEGRSVALLATLSDLDDKEAWVRFAGARARRVIGPRDGASAGR
jgi:rSAM/selenodomain-associated transferase 1